MKSSKFPTKIFVYVELNFSLKIKQRREKGVSLKALWRTFNNISLYRQYFRKYFLDFLLHSSSRTRRPSNCCISLVGRSRFLRFFPPRLKKSLPSVLRAKYQKLVFSSLSRQSVSYFVQSNEEQRQTADRQTAEQKVHAVVFHAAELGQICPCFFPLLRAEIGGETSGEITRQPRLRCQHVKTDRPIDTCEQSCESANGWFKG